MSSPTPGIRQTAHGWQVFVKAHGVFRSKHFPKKTPLSVLKATRAELHAYGVLQLAPPQATPIGESFAADCQRYLAAVAGMATISDRKHRIELWAQAFGDRSRSTITAAEIRAVVAQWQLAKVSPGTINTRLTALRHLWTVLDGRQASNPVREIARFKETPQPLALPSWDQAVRVTDRCGGQGGARLRALRETGWPSAVLKRVRPDIDLNFRRKEAQLFPRRKGGGTRTMVVPLTDRAIAALKEMVALDAFGPWSNSALHSQLHRACDALGVRRFRVYDLRHLFLTTLARASKDERGVSELALHSDSRQTRRYTEQAASTRARAALATLATFSGNSGLLEAKQRTPRPAPKSHGIGKKPRKNRKLSGK